ncbi:MAG: hypothetical protein K8I02_02195 [Candidatus Methylomirabilis sp.]|nr:hypothetical protein [Deltaproteobacteria bacterium]
MGNGIQTVEAGEKGRQGSLLVGPVSGNRQRPDRRDTVFGGEVVGKVKEEEIVDRLVREVEKLAAQRGG